jgi:hypothetical protein
MAGHVPREDDIQGLLPLPVQAQQILCREIAFHII